MENGFLLPALVRPRGPALYRPLDQLQSRIAILRGISNVRCQWRWDDEQIYQAMFILAFISPYILFQILSSNES